MAENTKIAWTDNTFNPAMGCVKISPGCTNCYAETLTKNRMGLSLWGKNRRRQVTALANWKKPIHWNCLSEAGAIGTRGGGHPPMVFCASLCDVFEDHPTINAMRPKLWDLIRQCNSMDWQILTKRADRIADNLPSDWGSDGWQHVWLGVSVENQKYADERVPCLSEIPAVVRFVSYEPALGSIDWYNKVNGKRLIDGLDWVIYGGESGPGFRSHDTDWPRSTRDQCKESNVTFFFKQSPATRPGTGTTLDGETFHEFPMPRKSASILKSQTQTLF